MTIDVAGAGLCGLLVVIALAMLTIEISYAGVCAAVNGELTDEMKEYVQILRAIVASISGDYFTFQDGED